MVKNAVPCLGQLLAAHNPADWPSAIRPFNLLLRWAPPLRLAGKQAGGTAAGALIAQLGEKHRSMVLATHVISVTPPTSNVAA